MQLSIVDWLIIIAYLAFNVCIGLYLRKRATASTDDYFVGGRKVSWWLAGTSMVATTFAADTPLEIFALPSLNVNQSPLGIQFRAVQPDVAPTGPLDCLNTPAGVFDELAKVIVPAYSTVLRFMRAHDHKAMTQRGGDEPVMARRDRSVRHQLGV